MTKRKPRRSEAWFNNPADPGMTAIYLERYFNYGLTLEELKTGKPIIGIAQSGSDLSPCNRIHVELEKRVRDGIRDAGGIPISFPVHPIQETGKRPTAALDRNLAYLGLVEILHGYPLDGVVLTGGCDKTVPSQLMAAATVNIPAIMLSGGPMLDGFYRDRKLGSGAINWECRERFAAGEINDDEFVEIVASAAPSPGHCNTMGTALTMNSLAEALGMSLPGCAAIPAPYKQRAQMAYYTGKAVVELVDADRKPADIMTEAAFKNAIIMNSAIGGSSNAPVHLNAIARHMGIELDMGHWQDWGYEVPLLVNCQPAGKYLGESFYKAGGVPAVMAELLRLGLVDDSALNVNGKGLRENYEAAENFNSDVIRSVDNALKSKAGFLNMSGNLFDSGIMKTSVISATFYQKYLSNPADPEAFEVRAIVFEGPEDYHTRINDPSLNIDEDCVLIMRGCGPLGYPGSAEVVNMQPPDALIARGITMLPVIGDGRQSGTSACPAILNTSPEAAAGGGLAYVCTGDRIRIDLRQRTVNALVPDAEWEQRKATMTIKQTENQTPWQYIYRESVGQLDRGACMDFATEYKNLAGKLPRNNH